MGFSIPTSKSPYGLQENLVPQIVTCSYRIWTIKLSAGVFASSPYDIGLRNFLKHFLELEDFVNFLFPSLIMDLSEVKQDNFFVIVHPRRLKNI